MKMGHHINEKGEFQSDKYPDLPPDKIVISFNDRRAWKGLVLMAEDFRASDPELADDILARFRSIRESMGLPRV